MSEMSRSREYHGHPRRVCCCNHLIITHRSPRLDHGADPGVNTGTNPVCAGKNGGRRGNRSGNLQSGFTCFLDRQMSRIHPAHLPGTNAQRHPARHQNNRVGFDVLGHSLSECEVVKGRRVWLGGGHSLEGFDAGVFAAPGVDQQAPSD